MINWKNLFTSRVSEWIDFIIGHTVAINWIQQQFPITKKKMVAYPLRLVLLCIWFVGSIVRFLFVVVTVTSLISLIKPVFTRVVDYVFYLVPSLNPKLLPLKQLFHDVTEYVITNVLEKYFPLLKKLADIRSNWITSIETIVESKLLNRLPIPNNVQIPNKSVFEPNKSVFENATQPFTPQDLLNSWFPSAETIIGSAAEKHKDEPGTAYEDMWTHIRQSIGLPGTSSFFTDITIKENTGPKDSLLHLDDEETGLIQVLRDLPPDPSESIPDSIIPFVKSRWMLGDEYSELLPSKADSILSTVDKSFDFRELPSTVVVEDNVFSVWTNTLNDFFLQTVGTIYHTLVYWLKSTFDLFVSFFIFPIQTNGGYDQLSSIKLGDSVDIFELVQKWGDPFFSWYAYPLSDDFFDNWVGLSPFFNGFCSSFHVYGFLTVATVVSMAKFYTNGQFAWFSSTFGQLMAHFLLVCLTVFPVPQTEVIFEFLTPVYTFPIGLAYLLQSFLFLEETHHKIAVLENRQTLVSDVKLIYVPKNLEWKWSRKSILSFSNSFKYSFLISLFIPITIGVQGFTLLPQPNLIINNISSINFLSYSFGLLLGWFVYSSVIVFILKLFFDKFSNAFYRYEQSKDLTVPYPQDSNIRVPPLTATRLIRLCLYSLALAISINTVSLYASEQFRSEPLGFSSPNHNAILRTFWLRDQYLLVPDYEVKFGNNRDWLDLYYQADEDMITLRIYRPYVNPYFDQWRDTLFDRPLLENDFNDYQRANLTIDRSAWRDGENLEAERAWTNEIVELHAYNIDEVIQNSFAGKRARSKKTIIARIEDEIVAGSENTISSNDILTANTKIRPRGYILFLVEIQKRRLFQRRQAPRISRFEVATDRARRKTLDFVDRPNLGGSWLITQQQLRLEELTGPLTMPEGLTTRQQKDYDKVRTHFIARINKHGRPIEKTGRFNRDGSLRLGLDQPDTINLINSEFDEYSAVPPPSVSEPNLPRRAQVKGVNTPLVKERKRWFFFNTNDVEVFKQKRNKATKKFHKREKAKRNTIVKSSKNGGFIVEQRKEPLTRTRNSYLNSYFNPSNFNFEELDESNLSSNIKSISSSSIQYKRLTATETRRLLNPYFYVYNRFEDYDHLQKMLSRRDYIDIVTITDEIKDKPYIIEHRGENKSIFRFLNPFKLISSLITKTYDVVTFGKRHKKQLIGLKLKEKQRKDLERADRQIYLNTKLNISQQNQSNQAIIDEAVQFDKFDSSVFTRFDYERTIAELFSPNSSYKYTFYETYYKYPTTQLTIRSLADRLVRNSLHDPTVTSPEVQQKLTKNGAGSLALEHAHESIVEYHNSIREYHTSAVSSQLSLLGTSQTKSYLTSPYRHQFKGRRNTARRLTFTNRDEIENIVNADVLEYVKPTIQTTSNVDLNSANKLEVIPGPSLHENVPYGYNFKNTTDTNSTYKPWQFLWRKALIPQDFDFLPLYVTIDPDTGKLVLIPVINDALEDYKTPMFIDKRELHLRYIKRYFDPTIKPAEALELRKTLLNLDFDNIEHQCFIHLLPKKDKDKQNYLKLLSTSEPYVQENYKKVEKVCSNLLK